MHDIRDFNYEMQSYFEKIPDKIRVKVLNSDVKINNLTQLQNVTQAVIKADECGEIDK